MTDSNCWVVLQRNQNFSTSQKKCICLETRRWLLISPQKGLTSEETQKHLWCRCKFPIPEPILTWDLLTTTYPNNRAVSGNLYNSRWNQRSRQASGRTPRVLWMTTHYRATSILPNSSHEGAHKVSHGSDQWSTSFYLFGKILALEQM